jgi:[acyl-carrier-protein] S-malonyltransferase
MTSQESPSQGGDTLSQSREAWVFPGQGSQEVGMGCDLHQAFPAARRLFQEADETLSLPLSRLCFEGPEETLRQTINAQPAIMVVSLAGLEAAKEEGCLREGSAAFMAGHSLGEYTALVAAGALSLGDGLRLVRERGRLMQEAGEKVPGTMAAILGLSEDEVADVCRQTGAEVCNLNSPGQIVVGGSVAAVTQAMEMAKARGARQAIRLNVSGAFHSSLMRPAAEGMAQALAQAHFAPPRVPIVANSTARPLTAIEAIQEELMQQLHRPVLWQRSVERMIEEGVTTFVEIGPGRVLTSLIRRINGGVSTKNISGAAAIRPEVERSERAVG